MVSADVLRNVVGVVGNGISSGLFLAPVQTFWRIFKKKDVEEFSPDPYLATTLNCMLWVFYGLPVVHPNSMLVVTINGAGLAIEAVYLAIYLAFAPSKRRLRVLAVLGVEAVLVAALALGVLLGAHTHETRSMIVGIICVVAGSAMYASPLTVVRKVIKTKSVEYMPFFLSLIGLLNGICWTFYALIKFDPYITVPNGLGVVLSLIQLIVYLWYRKSTPEKEKNVELPITVLPKSDNTITDGNISIAVEQ